MLEIGSFVGFSLAVWAHAVGPDGHVTGLEINPDYAKQSREKLTGSGYHNVEVVEGDAREV